MHEVKSGKKSKFLGVDVAFRNQRALQTTFFLALRQRVIFAESKKKHMACVARSVMGGGMSQEMIASANKPARCPIGETLPVQDKTVPFVGTVDETGHGFVDLVKRDFIDLVHVGIVAEHVVEIV